MLKRKVSLVKVWSGKSSQLTRTSAGDGDGLPFEWEGEPDVAGAALGDALADGEPDCGAID